MKPVITYQWHRHGRNKFLVELSVWQHAILSNLKATKLSKPFMTKNNMNILSTVCFLGVMQDPSQRQLYT